VEVDGGRIRSITGDPENEVFAGYSCVKGRAQNEIMYHPSRLLHSQQRLGDGSYRPIPVHEAMDEIAARLADIVDRCGASAVAAYFGTTGALNFFVPPIVQAFMQALGSPMLFTPNPIDKPGRNTAAALHGSWMAPPQGFQDPDVALLLGLNSYQSYYGVPSGNPGKWLSERLRAGLQLIVVDPRATDIAKRATLHIQPKPGEDIAILACLLNVIISEGLYDQEFVNSYIRGFDRLASVVKPFAPELVARRADVPADELVRAARVFATAGRGYAAAGVGPGFSASSTLVHYLLLCLDAVCGHYMRAGERVTRTTVLMPRPTYKAQAAPPRPAWGFGTRLRTRGLTDTAAGLPTGVLPDEILTPGDGQVRALFSVGGNPVSAWPDQLKTIDAMRELELLVQVDAWMSATARMAHYVIAPTMAYEKPAATLMTDNLVLMPHWYGPAVAYGQYTPAIIEPPAGADLIDDWEFFYGLAQRLGIQLDLSPSLGVAVSGRINMTTTPMNDGRIDMTTIPTVDELIELFSRGSRIPLDEVKRHPHGAAFTDPAEYVAAGDPDADARLEVADDTMMRDLTRILNTDTTTVADPRFPFTIIGRRVQHTYNSSQNFTATNRGRGHNPAYMHPDDIKSLGLQPGDAIELTSARASIPGIIEADRTLRRGLISMSHCYGDAPDNDHLFREIGSPTNRLLDNEEFTDPYIGMPRMGATPVNVRPLPTPS
jgi:anaerobic selenocysteine-containing dehydrogenase